MEHLRRRVEHYFFGKSKKALPDTQLNLDMFEAEFQTDEKPRLSDNPAFFIDFLSSILPEGNVYLFGGILRDLALYGKRGFSSDIDLVVDKDWRRCQSYLETIGAAKNKFGGYRLYIGKQPIDIWAAEETWAIRSGYIEYAGISSLTETTVLNWDAILMNWRSKLFICQPNYLEELRSQVLDIVLEENPNPKGMAVRVFRHFCLKDPAQLTVKAAKYLARCADQYTYKELQDYEINSYGNSFIEKTIYLIFKEMNDFKGLSDSERYNSAINRVENSGLTLSLMQAEVNFGFPSQ